jgi:hypothetical protein
MRRVLRIFRYERRQGGCCWEKDRIDGRHAYKVGGQLVKSSEKVDAMPGCGQVFK